MQSLIGIEENSGSGPKTREETEHDDGDGRKTGVAWVPLIFTC